MRLELHCHSYYSKGTKLPTEGIPSPREILREAKRKGIGGVALTDHNSVRGWKEAREEAKKLKMVFIPGIEIHSLDGHVIGLGISEEVRRGLSAEETIERIREQGGIAVSPHPFDIKGDGLREKFRLADAAESFNSLNLDRFSNFLAKRKLEGFPQTAGSDAHTLEMVGNSINIVEAEGMDGILKEIKKGNVRIIGRYASADDIREWSHLRFQGSRDFVMDYIGREYSPFKKWISKRMLEKFLEDRGGFFRLLGYFGVGCSYGFGAVKAAVEV